MSKAEKTNRIKSKEPWYEGWDIPDEKRLEYSKRSKESSKSKQKAISENNIGKYQDIPIPKLNPGDLMPKKSRNGLTSLSLFSGGGGLDLGFDLAGFEHIASYEILNFAADTIRINRPKWTVFSENHGNVIKTNWKKFKNKVDVLHGGPPCQPFSNSGRQKGNQDVRDMLPEFVRSVMDINPNAFVMENVPGLSNAKFQDYLYKGFYSKLQGKYKIKTFKLFAPSFGIPQSRKRLIFVGIRKNKNFIKFKSPSKQYNYDYLIDSTTNQLTINNLPECMGVREALGLKSIGLDGLAPTIRCSLTGPRSTTSILSSTSSQKKWEKLGIWASGVQKNREIASSFKTKNGTFRLSVDDCALLQGFPPEWKFNGPVYKQLGQIGNSVVPPMAYQIAMSVYSSLK